MHSYPPTNEWSESPGNDSDSKETSANSRDVGKVLRIDDLIYIEVQAEDRTETLSCSKEKVEFKCQINDLVSIELALKGDSYDDLQDAKILKATPLRSLAIDEAEVTSWWHSTKKGIINGYIYFNPDSISHSYIPRSGDLVKVMTNVL